MLSLDISRLATSQGPFASVQQLCPEERAGEHVKKLRNPNTGRHWIGIWWKIRTVECKFRLIDQEKGEEMEKDILGSTCKEKNDHWLLECFHFLPFKSLLKETTTLGEICSVSSIVKQFLKLVSQYTISCVPTCCKQNQKNTASAALAGLSGSGSPWSQTSVC